MAEYYPLLAKAVAGLPNSTPEARRAIYDRAHKALMAQLKSINPPIADDDFARETEALAGAVARLESELKNVNGHAAGHPAAGHPPAAARPAPSAPAAAPIETKAKPIGRAAPLPPAPRLPVPPRRGLEPHLGQNVPPPPQSKPAAPAPASRAPTPTQAPPLSPAARPTPRPPLAGAALAGAGLVGAEPEMRPPRTGGFERPMNPPGRPIPRAEPAPIPPAEPEYEEDVDFESVDAFEDEADMDSYTDMEKPRAESMRLYAPQPDSDEARSGFRLWMVGGIVAVVVAIVAIAAWTLRDRPDDLAKLKAPVAAESDRGGKIVERIGGVGQTDAQGNPPAANADTATAPAAAGDMSPVTKPAEPGQTVPVAYRAALLVEAPEEQSKVKTYVGTVIWRLDNVSGGAGQPLGTAVHADVDIPTDKLKIALTLQKNTDPSLPASHTITIDFKVQPGNPTGGVKQINVPQLRQDDTPKGDALAGVPVPIMENSFLIGLARGTAEASNLQLLKERAWIDIPILLGNGKIAKLTFEKGAAGTRAIDDAIAAWQTQ
jgi:hypothetical protein